MKRLFKGEAYHPTGYGNNADSLKIFADQILFSDLANISFKSASSAC
ncbi:MAG: hypothetical protein LBJ00_05630 [Planctomycetaceae bacterium]|nr:hypothetical protein [Planctomycetaceae bacterium]